MATKTKTTRKTGKAAGAKKVAGKGAEDLVGGVFQRFEKCVQVAGDWCVEHDVPVQLSPTDVLRLQTQMQTIRKAVIEAGGQDNVPEAVLLYQQTLDDAVTFLLCHAILRTINSLVGNAE